MIHMLSRFDLKPGVDIDWFQANYEAFVAQMCEQGLVQETGKIGRRELGTPMDTDHEAAPTYYVIMSFRDRNQLDQAYVHLTKPAARANTAHPAVHESVDNFIFTCWRDLE